jgi:hypothetical protein
MCATVPFIKRRRQCALRHQPPPKEQLIAMPCRRATKLTVTPGSWVSASIASFSAGVLRRRRSGPFRSLFKPLLVIDTTLLLPLIEVGERVRSIKGPLHDVPTSFFIDVRGGADSVSL